mgnify:CR=1 FL=1
MGYIDYDNDITGSHQKVQGSDGRLNVSSRSDGRAYYNSRDRGKTYTVVYDHQSAAAGEFSLYIKNTSSVDNLVVMSCGLNAAENARIKLHRVTGTAAGGSELTPVNTSSTLSAAADVRQGEAGDAITGLTSSGLHDFAGVQANGHEEFRLRDVIRLKQNEALAIEYDEGTTGDFWGVAFMYFEPAA